MWLHHREAVDQEQRGVFGVLIGPVDELRPIEVRMAAMKPQFALSDYVEQALAAASYGDLPDGTFAGRIPPCPGVIAFAETLSQCEEELCSVLEDWILVGLKASHPLPVLAGIDLN